MTKAAAMPIYGKNVEGHSDFESQNLLCRNSWVLWNQSSYESLKENGDKNLYK